MKKYLMFGVLIFLTVVVTLPAWSFGQAERDEGQQDNVYVIRNQYGQHEQVLGGKSNHASRGLARAEERARFMEVSDPAEKPKPNGNGGGVDHKKKKK